LSSFSLFSPFLARPQLSLLPYNLYLLVYYTNFMHYSILPVPWQSLTTTLSSTTTGIEKRKWDNRGLSELVLGQNGE
jgi:Na+/melibiose symporter-like transporter